MGEGVPRPKQATDGRATRVSYRPQLDLAPRRPRTRRNKGRGALGIPAARLLGAHPTGCTTFSLRARERALAALLG